MLNMVAFSAVNLCWAILAETLLFFSNRRLPR